MANNTTEPEPGVELETEPWQPATSAGFDKSIECQMKKCTNNVFENAAVTVDVGGIEREICPHCVESELGVDVERTTFGRPPKHWFNVRTVSAFLSGALLVAILFSMLAW